MRPKSGSSPDQNHLIIKNSQHKRGQETFHLRDLQLQQIFGAHQYTQSSIHWHRLRNSNKELTNSFVNSIYLVHFLDLTTETRGILLRQAIVPKGQEPNDIVQTCS